MNVRFLFSIFFLLSVSTLFGQTPLERGKELLTQGKYREAISAFRQATESSPRSFDAWYSLADVYLRVGKADSAEIAARRALSIDDERADIYVLLSDILINRKNYSEATAILRRAIRAKVATAPLLTQLGVVLLAEDSLDQAIVAFSQAKESDPKYVLAYEGLGDAYMKQGVPAIAIFQYEKGVEIDSMRSTLYDKLGDAYYRERRYTDAARAYHNVLRLDSSNTAVQLKLGKLYFAAKLYCDAASVLKLYVKNPSANSDALVMHMEALYLCASHPPVTPSKAQQFEEALAAAEKILKTEPQKKRALRVAANSYTELKQHDKAITAFQQLGRIDTLQAEDYRRLAKSYMETKRDSLAANTLERAIALDSTELQLYNDLGSVYMRLRMWTKAAAAFEKRFQKETVPLRAVGAYVNYGACMMALENWDRGRWAFRTALSIYPQYIPGYTRLGFALSKVDSLDEAKKAYGSILSMTDTMQDKSNYKSEIIEAHQQIGFINLLQKRYNEALEWLIKADKLKPNDVQTIVWIAQAYHFLNKQDEACREYKRALKLDPKHEAAKKGVELLACD